MLESKAIYLQKVKLQNMSLILQNIWRLEAVSRIELVDMTRLTSGTITNLTQELIQRRIIRESESNSESVGRKRVNLRFDNSLYSIIGLDIGRTTIGAVMTDLMGNILGTIEYGTVGINDPEAVLSLIDPFVRKLIATAESQRRTIIGMGVSIPGPMDQSTGKLRYPPHFPGWNEYPIRSTLEQRYGIKVWIEDDARTSALAERWFGIGRGGKDLLFVSMGMGIGGGVIQNGSILRGANGLYSQIGHMSLMLDGPVCDCGNIGCWEALGSIPGILKRWSGEGGFSEFIQEVREGKARAVQCMQETIRMVEMSLTSLFNLYDPDVIVLGGKLYPYLTPYMEEIVAKVRNRVFDGASERVFIEPSTFGDMQSLMGAVALVFGRVLEQPQLVIEGSQSLRQ
ncbi:ROK family protein [Paenibacillus sp. UNC451MF]|uniref:ROK family protein n=1 Tax=Paenibacillus sp. UNC451MF TaxID=1449063 RepID=UPI00049167FD|nr:ROK family protein [Paenibacillus sp. UNC451MF]